MSDITVNFDNSIGQIKPMHGVNNGPIGYGGLVDVSHYYREAGIPLVRLHDPNWPHPREVDIPQIFPNFDADPEDPKSYQFDRTDTYIQKILDTGAKIVYRLGVSIEHTEKKYYTHPPKDFDRWARICIGIIKHYNQGWADGFKYGIEYWEIWNEANAKDPMWSGTFEKYIELYRVAATAIKKEFKEEVKVGGFAAARPEREKRVDDFLADCKKHKTPLDFFSWHLYPDDPHQIAEHTGKMKGLLEKHGFSQSEIHFNEWNYWEDPIGGSKLFQPGAEFVRRDVFEKQKNEIGASFAAAALILMQDLPIDVANYYDGQPFALYCGLFDYYGVPQKTFYAFKAFNELLKHSERVQVDKGTETTNIYCLAATDRTNNTGAILISNFEGKEQYYSMEIKNLIAERGAHYQLNLLDQDHDLQEISSGKLSEGMVIEVLLRRYSLALIRFVQV